MSDIWRTQTKRIPNYLSIEKEISIVVSYRNRKGRILYSNVFLYFEWSYLRFVLQFSFILPNIIENTDRMEAAVSLVSVLPNLYQ